MRLGERLLRGRGRGRRRQWRQRHHFVKLAVHKRHGDLDAVDVVVAGEIDCLLRMLKLERFERVGRPVSRTLQVQLRADVLKQNFHRFISEHALPASKPRRPCSAPPEQLEPQHLPNDKRSPFGRNRIFGSALI